MIRVDEDFLNYRVRRGESLEAIASRFGIGVEKLVSSNFDLQSSDVQEGTLLKVPVPELPVCPGFLYTASPGETLLQIADKFGVAVKDLKELNPQYNPLRRIVGIKVCVPVGEKQIKNAK